MTLKLRTDDLVWKDIDGEVVVLDGRDAVYLTVNGSGALLWRMLAENSTREDLVGALTDTYKVDEAQATADTDAFLGELTAKGLLVG